jgi:hypothetical protein
MIGQNICYQLDSVITLDLERNYELEEIMVASWHMALQWH